jgi:hypothetical protein
VMKRSTNKTRIFYAEWSRVGISTQTRQRIENPG